MDKTVPITSILALGVLLSVSSLEMPIPAQIQDVPEGLYVEEGYSTDYDRLQTSNFDFERIGLVDYLRNSQELDPNIAKMLDEDFWDLV